MLNNLSRVETQMLGKEWEKRKVMWMTEEEAKNLKTEVVKSKEIPQELKNYRKSWEQNMTHIDEITEDKIKNAVDKIPLKVSVDKDGSRLIEFTLWNKTYKILDPNLVNHTDNSYKSHINYNSLKKDWIEVAFWWMIWDKVDSWQNQKLKAYVKQKQTEWLHIPKIEEMNQLLNELWQKAWLVKQDDKIAMLMYLTGMYGCYSLGTMWLDWYYMQGQSADDKKIGTPNSRYSLKCDVRERWCEMKSLVSSGNLCMISCK